MWGLISYLVDVICKFIRNVYKFVMKKTYKTHQGATQSSKPYPKKKKGKEDTKKKLTRKPMGNFLDNKPKYDDPVYTQAENNDYILFWQKGSVFSQWYPSKFTVDFQNFNCAEQFMMYHKTALCDDPSLQKLVMASKDPAEIKALGRKAGAHPSFRRKEWESKCESVVRQGSIAKFSQNPKLKAALLQSEPKTLAEASPFDGKWGIGLAANNLDAFDQKKWRGRNLLGELLMDVRAELLADQRK